MLLFIIGIAAILVVVGIIAWLRFKSKSSQDLPINSISPPTPSPPTAPPSPPTAPPSPTMPYTPTPNGNALKALTAKYNTDMAILTAQLNTVNDSIESLIVKMNDAPLNQKPAIGAKIPPLIEQQAAITRARTKLSTEYTASALAIQQKINAGNP